MTKLQDLDILAVGNTIQLAGAIYQGDGKTFLCFFPEDRNVLPVEVLEMGHDDWKAFLRQTDLLETEVLTKASDGTLAKAILRKSQRHVEQGVSWRVFKRDGYACRYCGKDDVPLTVDHIVLWEEGGSSVEENLLSSCRKCNKVRGRTQYPDWLKHAYYLKVSAGVPESVRQDNCRLVETLSGIPRRLHQASR